MSEDGLDGLFGGSDDGAPAPPRPASIASSSRGSPKPSGTATPAKDEEAIDDLFGDDDDAPPSPARAASPGRARADTTPDTPASSRSRSPNPLEYPEEDVQDPGNQESVWATITFPKWDTLKPTDGKVWQMRLPAYVNVESKPYDPTLYRAGLETPEKEDDNMKRSRMIQVRNTVRWKWSTGDDGKPKRQSNSRLLRWSDGSVSMQLGSDLYDLAPSYGTTLSRQSDPAPKNLPPNAPGTDTTFLVHANDASGIMMTENTIAGHLSLVPASSSSKTHIELVRHVGQQHVKHSRMKVLDEIVDPEKAFVVQNTKKKATNKRPGAGRGGGGGGARKKADSSDDEDEDPRFTYDTDLPGGRGRPPKANEAEYEDDGFVIADSDEEEEEEEEEGEDDAAYGSKKSKSKKSKSKKRKGSEEMDEMELAEKRIEAAEREKKRAKRDRNRRRAYDTDEDEAEGEADGDGEEDMEMDVESD